MYTTYDKLRALAGDAPARDSNILQGQAKVVDLAYESAVDALELEFDTVAALDVLGGLATAANEIVMQYPRLKDDLAKREAVRGLAAKTARVMREVCTLLGLMKTSSTDYWARTEARRLRVRKLDAATIERKVNERVEARKAKDFARADAIRRELDAWSVEVIDDAGASAWKIKP